MKKYRSLGGLKKRCGCAKRTWETCAHPWFFTFQWKGQVARGSLEVSTREAAVTKLTDIKAQMMNGTYVAPHARPEPAPVVSEQAAFEIVAGFYLSQYVEPTASSRRRTLT